MKYQVGSKVKLKKTLSEDRIDYYKYYGILPEQVYTVLKIHTIHYSDEQSITEYQVDNDCWVKSTDIEDVYIGNLKKILE